MPSMMNQFLPLDKYWYGYFGTEHKVKEKKPRGKFRTAKLILCASQTEARRILLEYRTTVLSLGKHHNILNIKDAFLHKQRGSIYLCSVRKFCESETLNSFLISRRLAHSEETQRALLHQLADAVMYLHSHEISHNALTPYSVRIVESKGNHATVKLTDFGLAQICGQPDHENYELDVCSSRSLTYYLPPEANEAQWCNEFAKPNTAADVFMLGLMFDAIVEHSLLPQIHGQEDTSGGILASYLEFPGYGAVPIGKFMHENPSVDLDQQLYRRLSSTLKRLIRRMVFLEPDGRPPITGVVQMLKSIDVLLRRPRRSASGPLKLPDSLWDENDSEYPHFHPTRPKVARTSRIPYNPSISPIQKGFAATTISKESEKPALQRVTGLVRRASRRMKKTSDRLRKRGSANISS